MTLRDLLSTHNKELEINNQIVAQAEADAPKSGYETRQFYTLAVDPDTGKTKLETADDTEVLASNTSSYRASESAARPVRTGYTGYLIGDGFPDNGYDFGFGIQFPELPAKDDFFLRTDFLPSRLFRFDGNTWVKVEDSVRMNMTNTDSRQTLKTGFINNNQWMYTNQVGIDSMNLVGGDTVLDTNIDYVSALYVVLKLDSVIIDYVVADFTNLISNHGGKVRITLPVVDSVQQSIPVNGLWTVRLCNSREAQRQSLSKALRPKADL